MRMAKPRLALQLLDTELARFVSLLSHEAAGIALRILDVQFRTGSGLPDGKTTHLQLGLPKRRWLQLREELLRVLAAEDGVLLFKPAIERQQARLAQSRAAGRSSRAKASGKKRQAPEASQAQPGPAAQTPAGLARPDTQDQPQDFAESSLATQPGRRTATIQKTDSAALESRSTVDPDAGAALPPLAVLDDANASMAAADNVVRMPESRNHRKPAQAILPGMAGNPAAEAGQPDDIPNAKKLCFDIGTKLLVRYNGMTEPNARRRIGKLLTEWDAHYVYAAIADAVSNRNTLANPIGYIGNKLKDFPDKAASRAARIAKSKGKPAPSARKSAPKATASFMGLSKEKAQRLAERSRQIEGGAKATAPSQKPAESDEQIFKALAF